MPSRRSAASPTTLQASESATMAFSAGVQNASMSSIGGGTSPSWPRRNRTKLCCWVVNKRFASSRVSAPTTFNASMA